MSSVKPSDQLPRFTVRFATDMKTWLRDEARRNRSSETSEVVRSVRERMDRQIDVTATASNKAEEV